MKMKVIGYLAVHRRPFSADELNDVANHEGARADLLLG
jgi:hypothetical protein